MWKRLSDVSAEGMTELRALKKAKLYADEDIEPEVVEFLRSTVVNVLSALELGHVRKPDSFHSAFAFKKKPFLLTKNAKHYFDDRRVPFHSTHGVIAVTGDLSDVRGHAESLNRVLALVPYGECYEGMKIHCATDHVTARFISSEGCMATRRLRVQDDAVYQWVTDEAGGSGCR